jgi:hypothetical protein
MIPRVVKMAAAVSSIIGPGYEAELGNILGPVCRKGWSNNFAEWFLDGPDYLGKPTMFSYRVHHWENNQPYWAQRPVKRFGVGFNAIMHPVADSPDPPLTTSLYEGYGG